MYIRFFAGTFLVETDGTIIFRNGSFQIPMSLSQAETFQQHLGRAIVESRGRNVDLHIESTDAGLNLREGPAVASVPGEREGAVQGDEGLPRRDP